MLQRYRQTLVQDVLAGATGAIAGAPQAMAFAIIAGISPIYGLYTATVTTIVGALTTSSTFMTVGPTNALALVVFSALLDYEGTEQVERLFALTLMVGMFMFMFGVLRLGSLTRFVSNAVMTGFVTGAGLLIIMGQLRHITGYTIEGEMALERFLNWLRRLPDTNPETLLIGIISMVIIYGLNKTRYKSVGTLFAIVLTSALVLLANWDSVELVRDISDIPSGLPRFVLPKFEHIAEMLPVALAMAVLASVQSAAISQSIPQADGSIANITRDFAGQGLANIAGSFFQSMPACGSLSRTAVNVNAGARTRMANLIAGVLVGGTLILLGNVIERITMAALGGLLIVAAASLIKVNQIKMVWNVGWSGRFSMIGTFLATQFLPLEFSIYIGVAISLLLYVYTSATQIEVVQLVRTDDNRYRETSAPTDLPDRRPIVLFVHGNLYFAAVSRLEKLLPSPLECERPVVILRVRDNQYLGSTGIRALQRYAEQIKSRGGKFILAGVGPRLREQLENTGAINVFGDEAVFYANDVIFQATDRAIAYAKAWLKQAV